MRSKIVMPLTIFGALLLVSVVLFLARRAPEDRPVRNATPLVRVEIAQAAPYRFTVSTNGSVAPRTESDLIPQVSGEIIEMSPAMVAGGFFEAGDVLARIDGADYRVDREAARAQVARAKSDFRRADKELARQKRLAETSVASESRIDDARNAYQIAEASLREAEARRERAARDLDRTVIRAPYRGRVRKEQVDLGQFVNRGTAIARIYAVDYAEIRLPLPDRELAYLDVPLMQAAHSQTDPDAATGAKVDLSAEFAGSMHHWQGHLVRSEAELDPRSRMVHLVARVRDPFGLESPRSAPLAIGLFVDAEIEGQTLEKAFALPRDALRPNEQVYIVDADGRLQFRDVELARTERDQILVSAGIESGDRVCTSPLDAVIEGMAVRVLETPQQPQSDPPGHAMTPAAAHNVKSEALQ